MKKISLFSFLILPFLLSGCTENIDTKSIELPSETILGVCPNEVYKCGYINLKGEEILPFEYDFIEPDINEMRYIIVQKTMDDFSRQFYIFDKEEKTIKTVDKNIIINDVFSPDGYAIFYIVNELHKSGIIDTNGKIIIPPDYISITVLSGGKFLVQNQDYKYGIIDKNNNYIIEPEFIGYASKKTKTGNPFYIDSDEIILSKKEGDKTKYGVYSISSNEFIIPFNYSRIEYISDGLFALYKSKKVEYYDKTGILNKSKDIFEKEKMKIKKYNNNLFVFSKDKKDGIADIEGNVLIKPEYGYIEFLDDNLIQANENSNEKTDYYDNSCKLIDKFTKNMENNKLRIVDCKNQRCIVSTMKNDSDLFGLIDYKGNTILPFKYTRIKEVIKDFYIVVYEKSKNEDGFEYGIVDKNGNFVIPFGQYKTIPEANVLI